MPTDSSRSRRRFLQITGAASAVGLAGCTGSILGGEAEYPSEPISLIIPYSPGGGFDTQARLLAEYVNNETDFPVDIQPQNVTGGVGAVARNQVYDAEPDGYEIMYQHLALASRTQVFRETEYDVTQFTYLPQMSTARAIVTTTTESGLDSIDAMAEALQNDEARIGVSGLTTGSFTSMVLLGEYGGLFDTEKAFENVVVYDEGQAAAVQGAMQGDVQIYLNVLRSPATLEYTDDLNLLLYIKTGEVPENILPGMPTEEVAPEMETLTTANIDRASDIAAGGATPRVYAAPPELPDDRREFLCTELGEILQSDDFQEFALDRDVQITYGDCDATQELAESLIPIWEDLSPIFEPHL